MPMTTGWSGYHFTYPKRVVPNHSQVQLPAILHFMFGERWLLLGLVVALGLSEYAQLAFRVAVRV